MARTTSPTYPLSTSPVDDPSISIIPLRSSTSTSQQQYPNKDWEPIPRTASPEGLPPLPPPKQQSPSSSSQQRSSTNTGSRWKGKGREIIHNEPPTTTAEEEIEVDIGGRPTSADPLQETFEAERISSYPPATDEALEERKIAEVCCALNLSQVVAILSLI